MFLLGTSFAADAFIFDDSVLPWLRTASSTRDDIGIPATLTWSIVPDGTAVTDGQQDLGGSNLIAYLNESFGGDPDEADHTQQPWFSIFEASLGRWDELSGLTLQYEPNDDGTPSSTRRRGILGTRGDIRIMGASVDGEGGVLAFNFLPDFGGDMTIDTDETSFTNTFVDFRFFRNTIMHELGHGFGLSHVISDSDRLLMEPFTQTSFDGPQLDEVRAIQFLFGDPFEEANDGLGNGTPARATDLGRLSWGQPLSIGDDADRATQRVTASQTDFVSISNLEDIDYYTFQVDQVARFSAVLTPHGGVFDQSSENGIPTSFDADARSPLSLEIFDGSGEALLDAVDLPLGESGELTDIIVGPGTYYAQITGGEDTIQLYSLALDLHVLPGDYNLDGFVDSADFTVWRDALGSTLTADGLADGNGNGLVDQADFEIWRDAFGTQYSISTPAGVRTESVPEPASHLVPLILVGWAVRTRRTQRKEYRPPNQETV